MATEIDKMTDEFRKRITERGSIEVLGQHAVYSQSIHAQAVAAYRLGLEDANKLRGASSTWELIDAMLGEWEDFDGDVSYFYERWSDAFDSGEMPDND